MKRRICLALWLAFTAAAAHGEQRMSASGDDAVLAARDAYRHGERAKLDQAARAIHSHDLGPWVEYWQLRLRLDDVGPGDDVSAIPGVREFLERNAGTYLAERLRGDWLRLLGKRGLWDKFAADYPPLVQPDQDIVCYGLQARLLGQHDQGALDEARPLWFSLGELSDACKPMMDALRRDGRLSDDDVWRRLRGQLEARKLSQARDTAAYLPAEQRPDPRQLDRIAQRPRHYLDRLPANFAATRRGRELALFALARLAREEPSVAAERLTALGSKLGDADRAYAWGQVAWIAATRHQAEALAWYDKAAPAPLSDEQLAWRARAALRAGDWNIVRQAIGRMSGAAADQPDWVYWLGRADAALGQDQEARALFRRIAGLPSFYGSLAAEELGQPVTVPPRAAPPSEAELAAAAANPGLRQALALIRLDMRVEGVREWNWTLGDMDDRQLLAAAELARRAEVFDRAISAADRTLFEHDYSLRYLAPYREFVAPKTRELGLDDGWVYGLMRQESRFVSVAKSSVGAKGLMQLMPATARWVAKKIGLAGYRPHHVVDLNTNLTLGANYMRMVLDSLDNRPVLASAAYNAGPRRARQWCADRPLEGAIYTETIPFGETRDYVKKVMNNAAYYAALFENKPQSLKARLGVVGPRRADDTLVESLP